MAETPSCNDSRRDLVNKILNQFISMATNPPASVSPSCNDSITQLYTKILLVLPYI